MMTAQQLKNSILQRAIEGKLVEQRPEEGTAKELLKEIKLEKEKLVKEGKIKKSKPLPDITEEEIPFEIPDSWEWVRLGEIASKIGAGSTPSGGKAVYLDAGIKFIRSQNVYNDGLRMAGMAFISEEINNKKQGSIVQSKDILLNITGGSIGRCALVPDDFDIANINQHILIIRNINEMCRYYLHKVLISPYIQELIMSVQVGVSREGLSAEKTKNMLIPIPPLSEQHRIVAKIDELLPLVDQYDKAYSQLTDFNEKFPQDMKKSILQYAIEGKLVEQRPEEGTAKELLKEIKLEKEKLIKEGKIKKSKPLPPITEDEIPFDIPENWEWCYLNDIAFITKLAGFEYSKYISPHLSSDGIPLFKGKNIQNGNLIESFEGFIPENISDELYRSQLTKKCLLTPYVGTIGNIAIFEGQYKAHLGSNVGKIELFNNTHPHILEEYILFYLRSYNGYKELTKFKKATAQESISIEAIRNVIVPLPPLSEQHRIVAKIEELMPLCDKLVKTQ